MRRKAVVGDDLAAIHARREALRSELAELDQRAKEAELAARDAGRPTLTLRWIKSAFPQWIRPMRRLSPLQSRSMVASLLQPSCHHVSHLTDRVSQRSFRRPSSMLGLGREASWR
jgi:hypothetical protein